MTGLCHFLREFLERNAHSFCLLFIASYFPFHKAFIFTICRDYVKVINHSWWSLPSSSVPCLLSSDWHADFSMVKYFLLLASLMSQWVDIYPTSYISPTSLPTYIILLSLNGGLPQAFVLGPLIYICSLPQSCGFQCHGPTYPFHQRQSSSMTHWVLRTRQTSYHGLWKSFCFTAPSMFFTLSLTLSPLLITHTTLSFLFFIPWTHKHAPSCHRDFVLDVPYDWLGGSSTFTWLHLFSHSHLQPFMSTLPKGAPINSFSHEYTWILYIAFINTWSFLLFYLDWLSSLH